MTDPFDAAVEAVLKHEGSTFVDDPADRGGATKYGISLRFARASIDPGLDSAWIRRLTIEDAKDIYREHFWDRYRYALLQPAEVAARVFLAGVNVGPNSAHRFLQRGIRACGIQGVVEDGVVGPQTRAAALEADGLLPAFRSECAGYYRQIGVGDQARFLNGWLNRAYS